MNRYTLKLQANVNIGDTIRIGRKKYKVMRLYKHYALCDTGLYRECLGYADILMIKSGKYRTDEKVGRTKGIGKYE
jgi:hypothetical protein